MVKLRAKKLLALALSILMLTGTVAEWLPTALAVEPAETATEQTAPGEAATLADTAAQAENEVPDQQLDFQHVANGRPNLYVDFLGDNIGNGTAYTPGALAAPSNYNRDKRTNKIDGNTWGGYSSEDVSNNDPDSIIFWVGVGVDRTQVWELLKNSGNKGLTSLEVGFYYNKHFIEPYTGGDYAATITAANIANNANGDSNHWSDRYRILHAEADLPVEDGSVLRADLITQDEMERPSIDNIRNNTYWDEDNTTPADWRMTYVSVELKTEYMDAARRLAGAYTGYELDGETGEPIIPPEASGADAPPEYLMMIPFVVHRYDSHDDRLCLRLARDASHFSIGAGNDGVGDGADGSYAAWERVTTRNSGKDLKLQLRFAGDLNIWNVNQARVDDVTHTATLDIQNGGGSQNTARLSVQDDGSGTPVFVDRKGQSIKGLQGGTGMQLDLTVQSGYTATVWVYYDGEDGKQVGWPFATVKDEKHEKKYTFVMPNENVTVVVVFQPGNTRDFTLYLSEIPKPDATDYMLGNETEISGRYDQLPENDPNGPDWKDVSINSFDPRDDHPDDGHGEGPLMTVTKGETVTITVSTHPDYEARVHIYNFSSQSNMYPTSAPTDAKVGANNVITLPFGGALTFPMAQSDVDVVVEYVKAETKTARLEVWHVNEAAQSQNVKAENIAQLAYLSYDNEAAVSTAYSGQVYEKVDAADPENPVKRVHSAVHDPSYKTDWVPYSAATVSNSLGGDTGRTGRVWSGGTTSLMAALANATSESNLAGRFTALDLLGAEVLGGGTLTGLRKNLDGEVYGDGDLADAASVLWELRNKVLSDLSTGGLRETYYKSDVLQDGTTTYHHFLLTPAQVQAYTIARLEIEDIRRDNRKAYREVYQLYQQAKRDFDTVYATVTQNAVEPIKPEEPLDTLVTEATGLREYQGTDYFIDDNNTAETYIKAYKKYINDYAAYINEYLTAEDVSAPSFNGAPPALPARVAVPLLDDAQAQAKVTKAIADYDWDDDVVVDGTAEIETVSASQVSTRSGRTVWLLLEADSAYEVDSVDLLDTNGQNLQDPITLTTLEARPSTSFKNVYTFSMPQENCVIRVNYKLRSQRRLLWQVKGANNIPENVAHIEAYQVTTLTTVPTAPTDPNWPDVYPADGDGNINNTRPTLAKRSNEDHVADDPYPDALQKDGFPVDGLLVKSVVTVRLTCHEDYRVTVTATNGIGGNPIQVTANAATGVYTFTVPESTNPDVVLTVTYAKKNQAQHQAHIKLINYDSPYSADNTGLWDNNSADISALSDTKLHGFISLAPGYYIYTSYALGESGSYPYSLDGNAYNNGLGAGAVSQGNSRATVKLETTMPDEDLWVYVVVRKGLPPEEPANALTVVVLDEENTAAPLADNWARAAVYAREDDTQQRVQLAAAGKGATGGGALQVTHYGKTETGDAVMAGDRVELDLSAATGYYVAEVALAPSRLGGDLEWLGTDAINAGARKLQFTMPAGSTTVTVRFRKLSGTEWKPSYYLYAMKTETDRNGNPVVTEDNKITTATSETIRTYAPAGFYPLKNESNPERVPDSDTGLRAGVAGEKVTMTFQVAAGWYVQSVAVMSDGTARPVNFTLTSGDNDGGGGTFEADMVMPAGDAQFIVKYRQCPVSAPRPEIPEYAITLMVIDDDNDPLAPDPNTVTATFEGLTRIDHDPIMAGGNYESTAVRYIHAGDLVKLNHSLHPDYVLEYIIVNPTEQGIVPTYVDPQNSQFTMPARNITVVAKIVKKTPEQHYTYTADLILRPPAGMSLSDLDEVGQGTFTNGGGSLANYDKNAVYSLLLDPGTPVNFDLFAFDGYYIKEVKVEPAAGASSSLTGSFGRQSGSFVMPAANVHVNVFFEKLWPDAVKYDLTLKVNDPSAKEGNYAHFDTVGGAEFPAEHREKVRGGGSHTVPGGALDGQEIYVTVHREDGFYYDRSTVQVTDSSGAEIPWRFTATGIAFLMPPRSTAVEVTFRKDDRTVAENPPRKAILYIGGTVLNDEILRLYRNDGTAATDQAILNADTITDLHAGDLLHLNIEIPAALHTTRRVAAAYAVDTATGDQLILPITQVPGGGLRDFQVPDLPEGADPEQPIEVHVVMESKHEGDLSQTVDLVVQGPAGSGYAALAEGTSTVTAAAGQANFLHADQGDELTVTMVPATGYIISQLTVTDRQGAKVAYDWISMVEDDTVDPAVWKKNDKQQITFPMPATGGTVLVTYAALPTVSPDDPTVKSYTAQVVVNDDQFVPLDPTDRSENDAWLRLAADNVQSKLKTVQAGEWVDLDITVQAGYRIEPIFVSPQSFGIKPQLYLGDLDSQTTGFYMPAGDVTVYVRFVLDGLDVYNATLVVEGHRGKDVDNGLGSNHATIQSKRTGTKGPIDSTHNPVSVQAAPVREWVTVQYYWDTESWVSSVTVKDYAGRNVPFTQENENKITLPMVARDIVITVTYEDRTVKPPPTPPGPDDPDPDPTPELTPVRLHAIDMSNDGHPIDDVLEAWARVTHDGTATTGDGSTNALRQTAQLAPLPIDPGQTDANWGRTETIWVPAGRTVKLEAGAYHDQDAPNGQIYIHSAYVLYRDGGQMIECNLKPNNKEDGAAANPPGFYDDRSATFAAHPDYNDVYVFFTKDAPDANKYSATLMLKGPAEDTGSSAAIWTGNDLENDYKEKATVKVNGDHGRIVADRKEKVTVTVTPMAGYAIDYVLVTPLGEPLTLTRVNNGKTYTFSMPSHNVSICIYLKRSNEREFTATVHYAQQWDPNVDQPGDHNKAVISWSSDGVSKMSREANRINMADPAASLASRTMYVAENATVTLGVTLDDPYVVLAAYVLQGGSIVPLAPALEGTAENRSMTDNSLADGTATFTMPGGNVDVYVVTTNDPPDGVWHTAVLTVKDPDDSGKSMASISRDNTIDGTANALPPPNSRTVDSAPVNHDFITVREGQNVTVAVREDTSTGYTFDRPALLSHAGAYNGALRPVSSSPTGYVYEFTVGNCNSAVLANFKKTDAARNPLTVVLEDPDNPGDGTVTQTATVTAGTLDPLTVKSVSAEGAYQVIPNVEDGSAVALRAQAHPGYKAYAYWSYGDVSERIPLTRTGDVYAATVTMPPKEATITVTYYKTYTATITIHDRNLADQSSQAQMEARFRAQAAFPTGAVTYEPVGTVTVNQTEGRTASISELGRGTELTTTVSPSEKSVVTAVLVTDASGTHFLAPDGDGTYPWTLDQSDVDIVVMIDAQNDDPAKRGYVASVVTQGRPAGAADPVLTVAPAPNPDRSGRIWSSADAGSAVTVNVPAVAGYRVTVTGKNMTDGTPVTVTDAGGGNYTATMPQANLELTVTYTKVPTLTLRVTEPASTKTLTPQNATSATGGASGFTLTADGQTTLAQAGETVTVTATPSSQTVAVTDALGAVHNCPVVVKEITLRTPTSTTVLYTNPTDTEGAVTETFSMPDADATVIVRYALKVDDSVIPGPDTPDDDQDYYTAWVEVVGDDGQPENRVNTLWNVTRPGVYPAGSPDWACGAAGNEMKLSISVKAGYYAEVTAETRNFDGSRKAARTVIQQGDTGLCTASVTIPTPGEDVFVTVTYKKLAEKPEPKETQVTLVLVGHGGLGANRASVTGGALNGLATDGLNGQHLIPGDPTSRVYKVEAVAQVGDELRLSADWASGYRILRATVAVPTLDGAAARAAVIDPDTPDDGKHAATELDLNGYGSTATARLTLPGEGAVVTVYYGNIFEATLHIAPHGSDGRDVNDNRTSATDDRAATITSTGSSPIRTQGDRLIGLSGNGETIQTTAKPGNRQRLVGVVWESASQGGSAALPLAPVDPNDGRYSQADRYDFPMPAENVDFYAVYETEPEDPADRRYIAKVRFADGSQHQDNAQNAVSIANTSDPTAAKGAYWVAAKGEEAVVVTVKVADGYRAEILTAHADKETGHEGDHYDFYLSRTAFVPNLPAGKSAAFAMPADTDATVFVKFTKGYDLELEMKDTSGKATAAAPNVADVDTAETPSRSLQARSEGVPSGAGREAEVTYTPGPAKLLTVDGGVDIATRITQAAPYKVFYNTAFGGAVRADVPQAADHRYVYPMPSANTVESVVFYNDDAPLLAKVELRGESDIHGNAAKPIKDVTDEANTTAGTVWTTTAAGNTVDLTLTVAKGYIAKIKVRRDDSDYYADPADESKWHWLDVTTHKFQKEDLETADPNDFIDMVGSNDGEVQFDFREGTGPFGANISDAQHFRFHMPTVADGVAVTDVTVIVEFVFAGTMPQPFDPDNMDMTNIDLDRGFIYGENRGEFALIDVPTLFQDTNEELFSAHNYDKPSGTDPQKAVKFSFYLYDAAKDEYTALTLGVDVTLEPEDVETLADPDDPYNYYSYKTKRATAGDILNDDEANNPEKTYTGARFKLAPTEPNAAGARTAGAQAVYDMLQNKDLGSLEKYTGDSGDGYRTRLYIMAEDAIGQQSAYTQVWIRPHFTVAVGVLSYAPNHETTASLFRFQTQEALDAYADEDGVAHEPRSEDNFKHYRWREWNADRTVKTKPFAQTVTAYDGEVLAANKYYQRIELKTSELLGGYTTDYDPGAAILRNVDPQAVADKTTVYALTLEKISHLTYTRVNLDVTPDAVHGFDVAAGTAPDYYDPDTLTYAVGDVVKLITGDVDGNGFTKWQDYDTVYTYVHRNIPWNNTQTQAPVEGEADYDSKLSAWRLSTYNPESMAYRCDLNGDRVLSAQDVLLVQTVFDYNRSKEDYRWTKIDAAGNAVVEAGAVVKVLPFGFGKRDKSQYDGLFALRWEDWDEPVPVEPDPYWDSLVDPDETEAVPLESFYVDADGGLWRAEELPGAAQPPDSGGDRPGGRDDDAVMLTPKGDEAMGGYDGPLDLPAFDPGEAAELPGFDEEDRLPALPDTPEGDGLDRNDDNLTEE